MSTDSRDPRRQSERPWMPGLGAAAPRVSVVVGFPRGAAGVVARAPTRGGRAYRGPRRRPATGEGGRGPPGGP